MLTTDQEAILELLAKTLKISVSLDHKSGDYGGDDSLEVGVTISLEDPDTGETIFQTESSSYTSLPTN